ncbi:hypothetical protein LGL55_22755 [Clostridium tagluense]|uniref:hypothetical protein n=1 Tax=Clostridium tagluense TaxID=360422 RepID=UPI001C0D9215|nr:hypothetical protein [Clostridium tagluense]MBU3130485.1 hypothetical protein [Clostridium tagluense]MCB2311847.1 hypothetical protein [Clostridium tagluense]MCB2323750.1 hypothetical protein [Clostridium tagluense]MCB2336758.1 hypothetical protein [Clostridium tagluense]MCB2367003.1 hypothetical protein [Clostridium tagluense]
MSVVAISRRITLISSNVMFAATNENTTKDQIILQVEQLITKAENIGIVITKEDKNFS